MHLAYKKTGRRRHLATALLALVTICASALAQDLSTIEQEAAEQPISVSLLERRIAAILTPDQAEAFAAGIEPSQIELENGETLEEFITRQERTQQAGLVYKPITPCVLLDTRKTGMASEVNEIRTLLVRGVATDYSEYGGSGAGCGIPGLRGDVFQRNTARAVFISLEITAATGDGQLKIWPANEHATPTVSLLQYGPENSSTSAIVVSLCDEENLEPCFAGDIRLQTDGSSTHITATALGYFEELAHLVPLPEVVESDEQKSTESPFWEPGTGEGDIHYSDGKVGIGTSDPETELEVDGKIQSDSLKLFREGGSWSGMATFVSKNTEPPYIRWYHSRSGGSTKGYGYIQAGEYPDGKKRFKFVGQNGANFMFQGRVGIGVTADASHPLMLLGNYASTPVAITQNQVGGSSTMEFTTQDSAGAQATRLLFRGGGDVADIEFYRGGRGSEQATMFIEGSNGNVGIGTVAPEAKVQIVGAAGDRALKIIANGERPSYKDQIMLSSHVATGYGIAFGGQGHTRGGIYAKNVGGSSSSMGEMAIWSRAGGNILLSGGKVGVGTANPTEQLHVAGTLKLDGDIVSDGDICIGKCS